MSFCKTTTIMFLTLFLFYGCQKDTTPEISNLNEMPSEEIENFEERALEIPVLMLEIFSVSIKAALQHQELLLPTVQAANMSSTCPISTVDDQSVGGDFKKVLTLTFDDNLMSGSCSLGSSMAVSYSGVVTITFEEPLGVSSAVTEITLTASGFSFNGYAVNIPGSVVFEKNGGNVTSLNYIFSVSGGDITSTKTINGNEYRTTIPTGFSGQVELVYDVNDTNTNPDDYIDNPFTIFFGPKEITCTNVTTNTSQTICIGISSIERLYLQPLVCSCPLSGTAMIYDPVLPCPVEEDPSISTDYNFASDVNGNLNSGCDGHAQKEDGTVISLAFCQ